MSLDSKNLDQLRRKIAEIVSQYGVFQCIECSQAIKEFLLGINVKGKQVKLDLRRRDLPLSVIYDLRRAQQISTNGYHEEIAIIIDGN